MKLKEIKQEGSSITGICRITEKYFSIQLGIGVVRFLASIPETGIKRDGQRMNDILWLDDLIERGLIKEEPPGTGHYVRTERANNGNYVIERLEPKFG